MRPSTPLALVGMLALGSLPAHGQELPWWKKAEHWCIRYSLAEGRVPPCNELSHFTATFVVTEASFLAGFDGWTACVPGGILALGKEAFDIGRWGLGGQAKSTVLDLTFSAGGCLFARWLNRGKGKNEKILSLLPRVSLLVRPQGFGIRLTL